MDIVGEDPSGTMDGQEATVLQWRNVSDDARKRRPLHKTDIIIGLYAVDSFRGCSRT